MSMIEVSELTKKFGDFTAVDSLTFSVNEGEVFGLLGPNGAGKTTTVRMLCSLISSTEGTATIGGLDISNRESAMQLRKSVGTVPENVGLYEALSAYENLEFYGRMYEAPARLIAENIEKYLKMLDVWDQRNRKVATFSKGMKQKIAVARALIHDPNVLFLDEPTANLDPEASKVIRDVILDLKKEKRTIFINTHNLDEAQRICDRIGILKTRLIALDTPNNLERSFSQRVTIIVLDSVNDNILSAVRSRNPKRVEVEGTKLHIEMDDPESETPRIINSISSVGGMIRSVTEGGASLEDVYLKIVKEEKR
ncbi:MAG: ABC transporter ATP-binding protein [Thermoplasmataceae archaeon]